MTDPMSEQVDVWYVAERCERGATVRPVRTVRTVRTVRRCEKALTQALDRRLAGDRPSVTDVCLFPEACRALELPAQHRPAAFNF